MSWDNHILFHITWLRAIVVPDCQAERYLNVWPTPTGVGQTLRWRFVFDIARWYWYSPVWAVSSFDQVYLAVGRLYFIGQHLIRYFSIITAPTTKGVQLSEPCYLYLFFAKNWTGITCLDKMIFENEVNWQVLIFHAYMSISFENMNFKKDLNMNGAVIHVVMGFLSKII